MSSRIKKGDMVHVLSGRDKGRTGRVLSVIPKDDKALVEGINIVRKHRRARGPREQGGIVPMEAPIHLCKLMPISDGQPTRVRIEKKEDGTRVRIAVKTGKQI